MTKKGRKTQDVLKEQEEMVRRDRENAIARREQSNALVADGNNPWLDVSSELDKFVGAPYAKFSKQGEYPISDTETIPLGTHCPAHCDETRIRWKNWQGGKPIETVMGRVADRYLPPARKELGDTDVTKWELQDDGTRRDPWVFTMELPITRLDTGESFVFSTSSKGGSAALTACCGRTARESRRRARLPACRSSSSSRTVTSTGRTGKYSFPCCTLSAGRTRPPEHRRRRRKSWTTTSLMP